LHVKAGLAHSMVLFEQIQGVSGFVQSFSAKERLSIGQSIQSEKWDGIIANMAL